MFDKLILSIYWGFNQGPSDPEACHHASLTVLFISNIFLLIASTILKQTLVCSILGASESRVNYVVDYNYVSLLFQAIL